MASRANSSSKASTLRRISGAAPQRSAYGIPDQSIVLATSSLDLDRTCSEEFVETMVEHSPRPSAAVYLLMGDGELSWQKRKFESAGIAKRVGYAGRRKDLPGFLRIADIYLAEFPSSSAAGVLQAMSVEKPVVAMRWGESAEQSQAAAFAGSECTINGRDPAAYIERVSKIIRDPHTARRSDARCAAAPSSISASTRPRHLEQICDQLIQQSTASEATHLTLSDSENPIAEAA